jgi:hypothetical protein
MKPIYRGMIISLVAACFASMAYAQDRQPDPSAPSAAAAVPANGPTRTGKERMGRKWMDEQRIDNSNVPVDKRGSKPRPVDCLHSPSG